MINKLFQKAKEKEEIDPQPRSSTVKILKFDLSVSEDGNTLKQWKGITFEHFFVLLGTLPDTLVQFTLLDHFTGQIFYSYINRKFFLDKIKEDNQNEKSEEK